MLADVDGDGLEDIVGLGDYNVFVALSTGTSFAPAEAWLNRFVYSQGWEVGVNPRFLEDVNGDGLADIVGFANSGVYVTLSTGSSFGTQTRWVDGYGVSNGWNPDRHLRTLTDVTGDGLPDVVAFGENDVFVSVSTGSSFTPARSWYRGFTIGTGGWLKGRHPRLLGDVNGDGRDDIVGFGESEVFVSLSTGSGFALATAEIQRAYTVSAGYSAADRPRMLADVNGDGRADIIGFANAGVYVSLSEGAEQIVDANPCSTSADVSLLPSLTDIVQIVLPVDRNTAIAGALEPDRYLRTFEGDTDVADPAEFARSLGMLLNSPGDSVSLDVSADLDFAIVAFLKIGGELGFTVEVRRADNEFYDLAVGARLVESAGVEVFRGLGIEASLEQDAKAVFRFNSLGAVHRAIQSLVLSLISGMESQVADAGRVVDYVEREVNVFMEYLRSVGDVVPSQITEYGQFVARHAELMAIRENDLRDVVHHLFYDRQDRSGATMELMEFISIANSVFDDIGDAFDDAGDFFEDGFDTSRDTASDAYRSATDVFDSEASRFVAWGTTTLELARLQLSSVHYVGRVLKQDVIDLRYGGKDRLLLWRDAFTTSNDNLVFHLAAVEVGFAGGVSADLQAKGVSLSGVDLGITGSGNLRLSGRMNLTRNHAPSSFVLTGAGSVNVEAGMAAGAGVAGTVTADLSVNSTFHFDGWQYQAACGTATLSIDAKAVASAGAGVSVFSGAGRSAALTIDLDEFIAKQSRYRQFFQNIPYLAYMDAIDLVTPLNGISAHLKITSRNLGPLQRVSRRCHPLRLRCRRGELREPKHCRSSQTRL